MSESPLYKGKVLGWVFVKHSPNTTPNTPPNTPPAECQAAFRGTTL